MKTIILILVLLISDLILAQAATPTYTSYLRLRKYAQGVNPSADSLNANWTGIDNWADGVAEVDSINTFADSVRFVKGATFSAGANASVTFLDSLVSTWQYTNYIFRSATNATVGWGDAPFYKMHSRYFLIPNQYSNDSVSITYDDSVLTIDKKTSIGDLVVTTSMQIDSSVSNKQFKITPNTYTIAAVDDSVIAIDSL